MLEEMNCIPILNQFIFYNRYGPNETVYHQTDLKREQWTWLMVILMLLVGWVLFQPPHLLLSILWLVENNKKLTSFLLGIYQRSCVFKITKTRFYFFSDQSLMFQIFFIMKLTTFLIVQMGETLSSLVRYFFIFHTLGHICILFFFLHFVFIHWNRV